MWLLLLFVAVPVALALSLWLAPRYDHRYHDTPEPTCDYCADARFGSRPRETRSG